MEHDHDHKHEHEHEHAHDEEEAPDMSEWLVTANTPSCPACGPDAAAAAGGRWLADGWQEPEQVPVAEHPR